MDITPEARSCHESTDIRHTTIGTTKTFVQWYFAVVVVGFSFSLRLSDSNWTCVLIRRCRPARTDHLHILMANVWADI